MDISNELQIEIQIHLCLNLFQVMLGEKFSLKLFIIKISLSFSSTYVTCPCCPYESLGIKMQYLNLHIKNLRRYFVMEVEVRFIVDKVPKAKYIILNLKGFR